MRIKSGILKKIFMSDLEEKKYPSIYFYSTSSYRIVPVIITILVVLTVAALSYLLLYIYSKRKVSCSEAPGKPQNVIAGYLDRRNFGIAWDRSVNTDKYVIRIGEFRNFGDDQALAQFETDRIQLNVSDFDEGKTYFIRVTAVNACGSSPSSDEIRYIYIEA